MSKIRLTLIENTLGSISEQMFTVKVEQENACATTITFAWDAENELSVRLKAEDLLRVPGETDFHLIANVMRAIYRAVDADDEFITDPFYRLGAIEFEPEAHLYMPD